jgi:hypothetical protein
MGWNSGTYVFENRYVLLCEGQADKKFFTKLARNVAHIKFDYPWPVLPTEDAPPQARELHSRDRLGDMLDALDSYFVTFPELLNQIKGVLVVFDARDDPSAELQYVVSQFPNQFGRPVAPIVPARSQDGRPPVSVMWMPPGRSGGSLETLCLRAMRVTKPEVYKRMESYLGRPPIQALKWPKEKRGKARLASIIAATNRDDPTKALAYSFSGRSPIIDVDMECFRVVAKHLREFRRRVEMFV